MSFPDRGSVETPFRFQNTADLRECIRSVGDVIEHVIGDNGIEIATLQWDGLGINDFVLEWTLRFQIPPGSFQHPGRKIRQGDLPTGGNAVKIIPPIISGPQPNSNIRQRGGKSN